MLSLWVDFSVGVYLLKLNIENFDKMSGICSKLTIKTTKHQKKWNLFKVGKLQWRRSVAFVVNFEHILHITLVSPLLTLSKSIQAGLISFFEAMPSGERITVRLQPMQVIYHSLELNFLLINKSWEQKNHTQNRNNVGFSSSTIKTPHQLETIIVLPEFFMLTSNKLCSFYSLSKYVLKVKTRTLSVTLNTFWFVLQLVCWEGGELALFI